MKRDDVTTYNHKEYVSIDEFAKRVGCGKTTVKRKLAEGKLKSINIDGGRTRYLEWETQKRIWDLMPHDQQRIAAGRRSNALRYGKETKDAPKEPRVSSPTVSIPSADDETVPDMIDLSAFDKTRYADCLIDGEFDYDKLKLRLTAETYQQKLNKERGDLVERSEIVSWAKKLGTMLNSGLESIPQKYTSVLIAKVQSIVAQRLDHPEFEFTERERTEIRTILKGCGPEIMRSLRLVIMEMEEE